MSVSNLATQCDSLLAGTQTDRRLNATLRFELTNIFTRFRIWAGNVGAFAPGNASIDYRLRDEADMVSILLSMLGVLKTYIDQALNPPLLEEDEEENGYPDSELLSSSTGSSSSSLSLDVDSDAEEPVKTQSYENEDLIRKLTTLSTVCIASHLR